MTCPHSDILSPIDAVTESGIRTRYLAFSDFINTCLKDESYHNFRIKRNRFFKINDFHTVFLSDRELRDVNRFKSRKKQIEWMAGRFIVKQLTAAALGHDMELHAIRIEYLKEGAPFIKDFPEFKVSISHSGDYATAALLKSEEIDIGLDIEKIRKKPDASFMKLAFTKREINAIKPMNVFKLWTVKEAFLKYIKKGFNESLHSVEVIDDIIFYNKRPMDVAIHSGILEKAYAVCLISGPAIQTS